MEGCRREFPAEAGAFLCFQALLPIERDFFFLICCLLGCCVGRMEWPSLVQCFEEVLK